MRKLIEYLFVAPAALATLASGAPEKAGKYNVLFIAVDDLRPQIGFYGNTIAKTPNMDKLASAGVFFTRAYCQQAVCSPSRTSLLTGKRPDTTKIYDLVKHFRNTIPKTVTLPQFFMNNGYHTESYGKIYHGGLDDPLSWSQTSNYGIQIPESTPPKVSKDEDDPVSDAVREKRRAAKRRVRGPASESRDVGDEALPDGQTATSAIETLRRIKDKPFFLAVGFIKPHLPFVAPKKYFDLYDPTKIPLAPNPFAPTDAPSYALTDYGELRSYSDIPNSGPIPDAKARELLHGYYAATSYTDAMVGKVLQELEKLGLRDRTIVILWGDHGWQLGEHGLWCKHTNFELATRAPLVISVPGMKNTGKSSNALVEFVDIYPTLVELCGFQGTPDLEGTSFVPLLEDPGREWKKAAFSQYPRGPVMGYSMRTDRYRYTEWQAADRKTVVGVELYDHQKDPDENTNIALKAENTELTKTLSMQLRAGWKAAVPQAK